MKAHSRLQKEQISMLRQYRTGEIPDIQIDYKDILLPLMALTQMDSTISTEILVELFVELYKSTKDPA
jgi:DNA-dependent protein kinase catalytic subunit